MKRILLLTVFICLWLIPIFSQLNIYSKIDTTHKNTLIIIDNDFWFNFNHGRNLRSYFDNLKNEKILLVPDSLLLDKGIYPSQRFVPAVDSTQSYYNMPCIKPIGNWPMNIYKPDSTESYTLLIINPEKKLTADRHY